MIYAMNYANGEPFEKFRRYNSITAKRIGGADYVFEFSNKDIDLDFIHRHEKIFSYKQGGGLWLWKPYLIRKALEQIGENDWLFYADAGSVYINKIKHLIDVANRDRQNFMIFEISLLNREFTKREAFVRIGVEDNGENQIAGGYLLLRRSSETARMVDEWIHYNSEETVVSPKHFHDEIRDYPGFVAHRHDQSILTLLKIKNGYRCYRDPSDYGAMPFMYKAKGRTYNPKEHPESTYPTILISNRKTNPLLYAAKYFAKRVLNGIGMYG